MRSWTDIVSAVKENPEKEMDVAVKRDNKTLHISVTPEAVKDENKKTIGNWPVTNLLRLVKMALVTSTVDVAP